MDLVHLTGDTDLQGAVVIAVMNLRVLLKASIFLAN
jgi:hypothetical protein